MSGEHPFVDQSFPIEWSKMTAEQMKTDILFALDQAKADLEALSKIPEDQMTFDSVFGGLGRLGKLLERGWGRVSILKDTMNTDEVRAVHGELLPLVTEFQSSVHLNDALWKVVKKAAEIVPQKEKLDDQQKRVIELELLDFTTEGADLAPEDKEKVAKINTEAAKVAKTYSDNVNDSRNAFEYYIEDEKGLAGLPPSAVTAAKESAISKGQPDKWRFTLDYVSKAGVLRYADDEEFRKKIWQGDQELGCGKWDNEPHVWKLLELRKEKAKLLGYKDWPDYILSRRMAKNGKTAADFVEDLARKCRRQFVEDNEVLKKYIETKTGQKVDEIMPWSAAYWAEKQRKELYDFDGEQLRPYFSVDKVLSGLFRIVSTIYKIRVEEVPTFCGSEKKEGGVEVWHPEVRFFRVFDKSTNKHIGSFYGDFYPRAEKRGGAWMCDLEFGENGQPHLGYIAANLQKPVGNEPAYLNHDEVQTIFHEFGHMCHFLLCSVKYPRLNSMNCAWDFIELPSQFLENWTWERSALEIFAEDKDGNKIPEEMYQKMIAARNYRTGTMYMVQLRFGKLDMELHLNFEKHLGKKLDDVDTEVLKDYRIPSSIPTHSFARCFSHLFASMVGYSSGYYSYKWAEVLDADCFTRFQKEGILNEEVGSQFREKVLGPGYSKPVDELFRDFMGRDPDSTALLNRDGIKP